MILKKDQIVKGKISRVVEEAVFVDIGATEEVVIPKVDIDQVKRNDSVEIKVGDTIPIYIYHVPGSGGSPLGSIAQAIGMPSTILDSSKNFYQHKSKSIVVNDVVKGIVKTIKKYGAFIELPNGEEGLLHISEMEPEFTASPWKVVKPGDEVNVKIIKIDPHRQRISLSMVDVNQ